MNPSSHRENRIKKILAEAVRFQTARELTFIFQRSKEKYSSLARKLCRPLLSITIKKEPICQM